ncbi:Hsp70 family protein [Micromonospora sp. CPCC 205371]|nr:Hsp70 family protein [Micromonospora sp. CPCC 205371]
MGVDFGTSNTVAMLGWPDGRARPVLFDGAPILPSAVFADQSGELIVGRDAVVAALSYPERFEPYPKRRIDDGTLLLGDVAMPVSEAIAAVLRRVVVETQRVAGQWPSQVALTYPAAWGARRRSSLLEGAARAGITNPQLIPEPLAAAHHFANLLGDRLPVEGHLLVYDFGAGTFDASVLRRTGDGFSVLASEGLADTGGLDIDAAVVAHLGAVYGGRYPDAWQRLLQPASPADRRHSRQLWDGVRAAKELLSRTSSAVVHLPLLEQDAPITREQLDELARPIVDRTVTAARGALLDAGADLGQLAGVVLVGGASRMPIVATQLHRVLGIAATVLDQPELVVAEGSLMVAAPVRAAAAPPPPRSAAVPVPEKDAGTQTEVAPPPAGRRRAVLAAVAGLVTLIVLVGAGLFATNLVPLPFLDRDDGSLDARDGGGSFRTPSPGASGALVGALPSGATPSGGVPSGGASASGGASPRPGSSGTTRPRTTPAKPSGSGIKGTPLARYRNSDPPVECEGIGIPLTNSAKTGNLPQVPLSACTGGPTVKSSGGWNVTWFVDYENYYYKSRFVVELYECGGGLVKKVDTGVVEKTGEIDHDVDMDTSGISGEHYTKTRLVSLHLRLDGVVWTNTSNPVVTTACTDI